MSFLTTADVCTLFPLLSHSSLLIPIWFPFLSGNGFYLLPVGAWALAKMDEKQDLGPEEDAGIASYSITPLDAKEHPTKQILDRV